MHVLIVEDEVSLANELKHFLTQEHYLCDWAFTGREASEKIAVNRYDFILLDLGLPDYEGLDLLRETRELEHAPAIIVLTARGALEDRIQGLGLGADDYLPKPFSLLELQARMQLTEHIWGNILEDNYDSNYIDVHIKNLRKKLAEFVPNDWLETVRGVGYRLTV